MTEDMTIIAEEAYSAAREILEKAKPEAGELFVVGCSTSEVGGASIGTYSSPSWQRWSSVESIRQRRKQASIWQPSAVNT